jgi:uncharacterized DUF497 family protein
MTVRFEWDESKNRANVAKHGIGFDEARRIFSDPHVIIREDRVVEGEERLHALGLCRACSVGRPYGQGRRLGCDYPHRVSP